MFSWERAPSCNRVCNEKIVSISLEFAWSQSSNRELYTFRKLLVLFVLPLSYGSMRNSWPAIIDNTIDSIVEVSFKFCFSVYSSLQWLCENMALSPVSFLDKSVLIWARVTAASTELAYHSAAGRVSRKRRSLFLKTQHARSALSIGWKTMKS